LPEDRLHLLSGQEAQYWLLEALHWHGQRLLDYVERGHVTPARELQERAQRGQAQVAAADRVVPAEF